MKKAAVIMGSDSDLPVVEKAFAVLRDLGIPFEARVMSAHRTPEDVADALWMLANSPFVTGQILGVNGGLSVT